MNDQPKLKKLAKKLALTKETLRKLADGQLRHAQGGGDVTGGCCDDTGSSRNEGILQ